MSCQIIEWPRMLPWESFMDILYTIKCDRRVFQTPDFLFSLHKKFIVNYIEHGWVPPSSWPGHHGGGRLRSLYRLISPAIVSIFTAFVKAEFLCFGAIMLSDSQGFHLLINGGVLFYCYSWVWLLKLLQ